MPELPMTGTAGALYSIVIPVHSDRGRQRGHPKFRGNAKITLHHQRSSTAHRRCPIALLGPHPDTR